MNNQHRIEVAKRYISRYKQNDVDLWQPMGVYGDAKYLEIYNRLIDGIYSEARCLDEEYDDNGNITKHGSEYECEICQFNTASGIAEIFTWDDCVD